MSYILESLKKSDQERRQHAVDTDNKVVVHQPTNDRNGNDKWTCSAAYNPSYDHPPKTIRRFTLVACTVFCVLMIAALGVFFVKTEEVLWEGAEALADNHSPQDDASLRDNRNIPTSETASLAVVKKPVVEPADITDKHSLSLTEQQHNTLKSSQQTTVSEPLISELYQQAPTLSEPTSQSSFHSTSRLSVQSLYESEESELLASPNIPSAQQAAAPSASPSSSLDITSIYDIERTFQKTIPSIAYDAHIYASDSNSGFVILNGVKWRQGERMRNGIYIEKIAENELILSYQGVVFSLPAMRSWQAY